MLHALQASLAAQVRGSSTSVHLVSPSMVATDLLAASARCRGCLCQYTLAPVVTPVACLATMMQSHVERHGDHAVSSPLSLGMDERQVWNVSPKLVAVGLSLMPALLHVVDQAVSKEVTTLFKLVAGKGVVCGQVGAQGGTLPERAGGGASYSGRVAGAAYAWGEWQWQIFQVSGVRPPRLPSAAKCSSLLVSLGCMHVD
jgi:hypothetical protein